MNLFDTLNEALNEEVVSKLAKMTDEEPANTKKALDGIFYTLVAGLIRRTGSAMSVNMLYNQIQKGNQGGELIRDVMAYLNKKDKLDTVLKTGESLVSQIFPAAKSPLISMIGAYAGIKKSSSTMYSSLAVPILIDAVSKEIGDKKLDVEGLVNYLLDHHETLFKDAPEGLMEKMIPSLGLQELTSAKFSANRKATPIKPTVKSKPITLETEQVEQIEFNEASKYPMKIIIPILVGLLAIVGGLYWYFSIYQPSQSVQEEAPAIDSTVINTPIDTNAIKPDSIQLKKDTVAVAPTTSLTEQTEYSSFGVGLNTYLTNATSQAGQTFTMTNVAFMKGTQALDAESDIIVSELADIMKKYPKLQIQIQGHSTDAIGVNNMKMGVSRAFAIKKKLLAKEVASTRIDAVGSAGGGNKVDIKIVAK
jgi:outer membrane protein OmpA-like peptidoglycan-associated protein